MVRGGSDYLYLRLAIRARRVLNAGAPVQIFGSAAFQAAFLREVVWIVIGRDTAGNSKVEGTAFTLNGVGIISAYHVFTTEACVSYELRPSSRPDEVYPVSAIRPHNEHDLVIIESEAPILAALKRQNQTPTHGDRITLAGYPRWLGPTDDLLISPGEVIQPRKAGATEYIIGTPLIRGGNSGGPLLNGDGYVVGVAMYDGSSPIAPNGSVAIRHVEDVIGEPARTPF